MRCRGWKSAVIASVETTIGTGEFCVIPCRIR
jgi:hypothetical protein